MSAFVVDPKTINRVVSYLMHDTNAGHIRRALAFNGMEDDAEDLATRMMFFNVAAVNARYRSAEDAPPCPFTYEPTDRWQALKSLRCWLYQCAEGDVPEEPLFKTLDGYSSDLALSIVSDRPEYVAAEWA